MILKVVINGTDVNPYEKMGLRQNPFPQIPKAELDSAMVQLNRLAAEPIKDAGQIRAILQGWTPEFIELCIRQFKPGVMVTFSVTIPEVD
jgi:hypothetical protein